MLLFEPSAPERRRGNRKLPLIPNEIYIYVFELIAPPTGHLSSQELRIFGNLSRVCRSFANFCLPRIYSFLIFSDATFHDHALTPNDLTHKASNELCAHIAAQQPLALSLAERVRGCYFVSSQLGLPTSVASQLLTERHLAGMSHMKNIRKLRFSARPVGAEYWSAIANLDSLEELSFDSCILEGPGSGKPVKKIRASCLKVFHCLGHAKLIAGMDPHYLRTLSMDCKFLRKADLLFSLMGQRLFIHLPFSPSEHWRLDQVHTILVRAPHSVEELWIPIDSISQDCQDMIRSVFDDSGWKRLPHLRSLGLHLYRGSDTPVNALSFILDRIASLAHLRSFTLKEKTTPQISAEDIHDILHERLGPSSSLKRADIYGKTFHLIDGKWSYVH